MAKHINQVEPVFPKDRDALIRLSATEQEPSLSVGGLAIELGLLRAPGSGMLLAARSTPGASPDGSQVVAKLVLLWRREKQISVEDLAKQANLEPSEVLAVETANGRPGARVLYALSGVLQVSYEKLMTIAGNLVAQDATLSGAAVKFAARSEPMDKLTREEREALREFVRVLAE
jgi:transcriptional regulator with XRE-family HTH domain